MQATMEHAVKPTTENSQRDLFIVLCASGFDNIARARSALMFASLAASADYRTVLYCIQNAVDVMVKGGIEAHEKSEPGTPSMRQRLQEAVEMGVEIQCCTQTMANKKLGPDDMIPEVTPSGAMSLIELATHSKGSLCF